MLSEGERTILISFTPRARGFHASLEIGSPSRRRLRDSVPRQEALSRGAHADRSRVSPRHLSTLAA